MHEAGFETFTARQLRGGSGAGNQPQNNVEISLDGDSVQTSLEHADELRIKLKGLFATSGVKVISAVSDLLRQAAGIVGSLQRIPCFIASCDPQPPSSQASP